MMYFRALTEGIADLPEADAAIRAAIDAEAEASGWPSLHAELSAVDAVAGARIEPNDSQRIQRALEVYRISGRSLSEWQADAAPTDKKDKFLKVALVTDSRPVLHERIAVRLQDMMDGGACRGSTEADGASRIDGRPSIDACRWVPADMVVSAGLPDCD